MTVRENGEQQSAIFGADLMESSAESLPTKDARSHRGREGIKAFWEHPKRGHGDRLGDQGGVIKFRRGSIHEKKK